MTTTTTQSLQQVTQNIKYAGTETEYSAKIVGETVNIQCNLGTHNQGSSKVKLINRIDYNWEFRCYPGQLVAAHISGNVIAYAMKGKDGGMVRVINQQTNQRALIKNLKNDVKDIAFAFSKQQILLGCIDDEGNVLIYEIGDQPQSITTTLLLHVYHPNTVSNTNVNYRIIWCPFCCDEEDADNADEPEKMFVILNGNKAEVWNVGIINAKHGVGPIKGNDDYDGFVEITHAADLVDASFSSDGTAIAIACSDGYVKFFQIYLVNNEKQKCLHEWVPHDGKPISSIIFVDNLLEFSTQCWKFTITGANQNTELKLWSCESWTCLQTIHFKRDPKSVIQNLYLKASIDYTGQYLIVSDVNNKALYVLELKRDDEAREISVTNVSQFLLPTHILSFYITEASCKKLPFSYSNSNEDLYGNDQDDPDDYDEDTNVNSIFIKMLVIQQKKFQECNILFQPDAILSEDISSVTENNEKVPKLDDLQSSVTLLIQQQTNKNQMNLLTPEVFNTSNENSQRPGTLSNESTANSGEKLIETTVENLIDFQKPQKDNFASGGSSPSREVQEILSLNNSFSPQDFFDNLPKIHDEQEIPQKDYNETETIIYQDWPKVPVVKEKDLVKTDNDSVSADKDNEWKQNVNFRLNTLQNAIRDQSLLLQKLHQDIKNLSSKNAGFNSTSIRDDFANELDASMSKQQLQIAKVLENLINMQKNNEREQHERLVANINQIVKKCFTQNMTMLVNEIKLITLPAFHNLGESLIQHVDMKIAERMNNDKIIRDSIGNLINGKALVDAVSPSLEKCYSDMISKSLLPTWEKICVKMFQQINETFTQGTKEYTASVETYMERQRGVQEKGKDLIVQMQGVADNLQSNINKLNTTLSSEMSKQFKNSLKQMQDNMLSNIKDVVAVQVGLGFKNHASVIEDSVINAVRSRAVTPSSHVEAQVTIAHIDQLLSKENYSEAFQLALSAENLNYVIHVCEQVDVNLLFQNRALPQNCLLALMQQLSVDLTLNTGIKLSYIRAAFLALSPDHPTTKQFIPKVLKDLLKHLNYFITTNLNSKHLTDAKLLKMAVESRIEK